MLFIIKQDLLRKYLFPRRFTLSHNPFSVNPAESVKNEFYVQFRASLCDHHVVLSLEYGVQWSVVLVRRMQILLFQ